MIKKGTNGFKHLVLTVTFTIAVLMLFTLLPSSPEAYAAGNPTTEAQLQAALNDAGGGATTLGDSITLDDFNSVSITADTTLVIPSGTTLTISNSLAAGIRVNTGATLTVTGGGVLDISNLSGSYSGIEVDAGAVFTVTGGCILDINSSSDGAGRGIYNAGTVVLGSGTVNINNTAGTGIKNQPGASLAVDGASVYLKNSGSFSIDNSGSMTLSSGTVNVENTGMYGIYIGSGASLDIDQAEGAAATLEIKNSSNRGIQISGGSMTLSAGTVCVENSGVYGIYNQSGTITVEQTAGAEAFFEVKNSANTGVFNGGTVTLSSGTVTIGPGSSSGFGFSNGGTLNAAGAEIDITGSAGNGCIYNSSTANFSAGTVNIRNSANSGIRNTSSLNLNGAEVNIQNTGTGSSGIYNYSSTTTFSAGTLTIENTEGFGIYLYDGTFVPGAGIVIIDSSEGVLSVYAGYAGASIDWSGVNLLLWYQGEMYPSTFRPNSAMSTLYYGAVLDITDGTGTILTPGGISTGGTGHSWLANEPVSGRYAIKAGDVIAVNGGTLTVDQVTYSSSYPHERPVNFPGGVFSYQAPGLTAGTADRTASADASVQFDSTKAGNYYYQIDGAPADAAALIASAGGTRTASMSLNTNTLPLTGLSTGAHTIYVVGEDTNLIAGNILSIAVPFPPAVEFQVTAPSSALINTASAITIRALDDIGNVAAGYRGTVSFTSSDTAAVLPADYTFTAEDDGIHTFTGGVTLKTAGTQTITAADSGTPAITGTSGQITVNKYATSLSLSADLTTPQSYPQSIVLTAELSGADNNAGRTITFSVNGGTHTAVTDPDGIATYTVSSPVPDDYTFGASFAGDGSNDSAAAADITGYSISKGTQTGFAFTAASPSEPYSPSFSYTNTAGGGQGTGAVVYSITGGTAGASIDPVTGEITGVSAAGTIVVTAVKAADGSYNQTSATYTLTVLKIDPAVIFPTSATVTYGQPLSAAVFGGQSGAGVFAYTSGSTVPTVSGTPYEVTFTPDESDIYNILRQDVVITVNGGGSNDSSRSRSSSGQPADTVYRAAVTGTDISPSVSIDPDKSSASVNVDAQLGNILKSRGAAVINMPSIPGINSYTLSIPADYLSEADGAGRLTFRSDSGSITLAESMLAGIAGAEGKKAEITISEGDKTDLAEDIKAAVGGKPLLRLSMSLDGKQTEWNNPDAPVTVSIPYTPTKEELANPEAIVVWYIDGSGNAVSVNDGHFDPATGAVIFTTTHFSYYAVAYNKLSFSDVPAGSWYHKAVSFIAAREITTGAGNDRYRPGAKLTRGEFLGMMMRAYGIEPDVNSGDNFSDGGSTWYTGYLAAAKKLGISGGIGSNMFGPDKEITRQEMFTLLYNGLKVTDNLPQVNGSEPGSGNAGRSLSDFSDTEQIVPWAKEALTLLTEAGDISGSGGRLAPESTTTRAEMAQVLYNLLSE